MKNKKKFRLSRIFRNNNFILILSVIISVLIWINMSLSDTNESTATINNIPIQISLSNEAVDNGLQIFSGNDQTASVTVTGNRVTLGSITSDDIVISAQTAGTITTSGTYPLSLTARKADNSDNFEITSSVSPSVITIFVDHMRESTFDIENKITYNVSEGYHANVALSSDSITVSGPQTEVSKIASVGIDGEVRGELKNNTTMDCDVKLYDNSGAELTNNMITLSEDTITAEFTVLPEKKVPLRVSFKNKPSGLDLSDYVTISPSDILVAAPQDILDSLKYVSTERVDFTTLNNKKTDMDLAIDLPSGCVNLNENETAEVTIDLSSFGSKRITANRFEVNGLKNGYSHSVSTDSINVVVKGPKNALENVTSSDLTCVIDASNIDGTTGSISLPVIVRINGQSTCWAYGNYKANIYVTKD